MTDVCELTRQYQAILEARRILRTASKGVLSRQDERDAADRDVDQALDALTAACGRHALVRTLTHHMMEPAT